MFLESSNPRKSKIITAAIEVDEDYRAFRAKREPSLKYPTVFEPDSR